MESKNIKYKNVELINLKNGISEEQIKFVFECFQDYNARKYFANNMQVKNIKNFIKEMKIKLMYKYNDFVLIKSMTTNGYVGFIYTYKYKANDGKIHITTYIKPDKRNSMYGVQGCLAFYDYLFKKYSIRKVYCSVVEYNKTSVNILESLEFKLEGNLKKHKYLNGKYYNVLIYALYREDFKKIKEKFKK